MDRPTMLDNPYAAPTADEAALPLLSSRRRLQLAFGVWLAGANLCGVLFAAERLLGLSFVSDVLSLVYLGSICLCAAGLGFMKKRWFVTFGLALLTFIGIIAELLVVARIELMLRA